MKYDFTIIHLYFCYKMKNQIYLAPFTKKNFTSDN